MDCESTRLAEDATREKNWKRWGPYLSERQWGTVREDYSPDGACWGYFPHDHARSRAYRWGEDGLLGICDRECRLCFGVALWNNKDPILKERLFGLTGPEGNHGEDCKELYYYLDSTPTHSYMRALYKYPQAEFPYAALVETNRSRTRTDPEYELEDTGVLEQGVWDVVAEYAKEDDNDIVARFSITNSGPATATVDVLPTLWFRNTWVWGGRHEGCTRKPTIQGTPLEGKPFLSATTGHDTLEPFTIFAVPATNAANGETLSTPKALYTDNETNFKALFGSHNIAAHTKDAFHRFVVNGEEDAVCPDATGTKLAYAYKLTLDPGQTGQIRLRLRGSKCTPVEDEASLATMEGLDAIISKRKSEADAFYIARTPPHLSPDETLVMRQAYAGLLWSKQFFHYVVSDWLVGDPTMPSPPPERKDGRNKTWKHMFCRDVISMPDKWEYPWFAAWDLAFHMLPMSRVDPKFAKDQLVLLLREWYMHPNGQIPAYEFAFDDVNPPVHAWAVWRVYNISGVEGKRDHLFLARCFHKLTINFTWWVNRIDVDGRNLFGGGFLGLDNIGVFDRGKPLPVGGTLEQADGTSWMAFYCVTMLDMALELARTDSAYEDIASKFFEHFVEIVDTMNDSKHGRGLWDEEDGFYYDRIRYPDGSSEKLKISSLVAIIPLYACLVLDDAELKEVPHFRKRLLWFMKYRKDLAKSVSFMVDQEGGAWNDPSPAAANRRYLLAIPSKERLTKVLSRVLDEKQFLSPYGIRSLSKQHESEPFIYKNGDEEYRVDYSPGEADSPIYGGNSNWRGPVWMPCNWLLVESLNRYHYFYGDAFTVECPTGSGVRMTLEQVATELTSRLTRPFLPNADGLRPCYGSYAPMYKQPGWQDLVQFHEYFHAETGRGCGASHQTGWTALVARCFDLLSHRREKPE
eukprot:m.189737 g.189737  ORF g.189737 m.189737 type:complete len:917 (+) comp15433_c0_seq5:243-2993(+)